MLAAGLIIEVLAVLSAIGLYRTLKYGPIMHCLPYFLCVVGGLLLYLASATDYFLMTLTMAAITGVIHAIVLYDIKRRLNCKHDY